MITPKSLTLPVPGARHTLEARISRAQPARPLAVVAPPHPLYGGSIGNPVVRAIERSFQARGFDTLAFNFRGVGESTGEPSGAASEALADYLAAARGGAPLAWLSGYSFGACAALAAALELGVERVLMVGPPLALLDPQLLPRFAGELRVVLGSGDEYAPLDALRELLASAPGARLELVDGADHFFLGSQCQQLANVLATLDL